MKVDFNWKRSVEAISTDYTGKKTQLFLANEAKRLMDPYVPALNLMLARNVRVYVENGKGIVHYLSPHARYNFEGKVMVAKRPGLKGSAKIVLQPGKDLNYSTFRHPLATAHWNKAMMAARGEDLIKAMQNYVGGKK